MAGRLPDPTRSRAVLIGAARLPGLSGLLIRLRTRLADTVTDPVTLTHPRTVNGVRTAVRRAATDATDLLLVYLAGQIRPDQDGRPRLLVANTVPDELAATAVSLDELAEFIADSPAALKVLLLDCGGWTVAVPGAATLAAGAAHAPQHGPTAFTEALLAALDNPDPPSFARLRRRVDRELVRRDLPRAQASAADIALVYGVPELVRDRPADPVPAGPAPDEVRLGTEPATVRRRDRGAIIGSGVFAGLVGLWLAAVEVWWSGALAVLPLVMVVLSLVVFIAMVFARTTSGSATLLRCDQDGLTLDRLARDPVRVAWSDVVTIGVLPAALVTDGGGDVLAVRLRSGAPRPVVLPKALVARARGLDIVPLARVADLGTPSHQLLAELGRFAEDRVARGDREWLARHPELGPP